MVNIWYVCTCIINVIPDHCLNVKVKGHVFILTDENDISLMMKMKSFREEDTWVSLIPFSLSSDSFQQLDFSIRLDRISNPDS